MLPSVKDVNERRLEASTRSDFVPIIEREIRSTKAPAFRLHVIGDFYNEEYVRKWIEIATDLENVIFFGSTRTWRCGFLGEVLKDFRDMPNVFIKASTDGTDTLDPTIVGWRVWSIDGAGDPCPHDYSIVQDCSDCGRCWKQRDTDTSFRLRWGKQEDYLALIFSMRRL